MYSIVRPLQIEFHIRLWCRFFAKRRGQKLIEFLLGMSLILKIVVKLSVEILIPERVVNSMTKQKLIWILNILGSKEGKMEMKL